MIVWRRCDAEAVKRCFQAQRVEEVRKMSEQYSTDLKERIDRKMETTGEKREAQLQSIQERIREHVCFPLLASGLTRGNAIAHMYT